jgi:UDP-N-acetyl-D-mannosaminuronic acid dehydrogenase
MRAKSSITDKSSDKPSVVIIGMGYVGLTFAVFAADMGIKVFGIEKNINLANEIADGKTIVCDLGLKEKLQKVVSAGFLKINHDVTKIEGEKVYVVTVGTPLQSDTTTIDQMAEVLEFISTTINEKDLIIIRSTVEIGTTRNLSQKLRSTSQKEFYFSMCPERTVEGRALEELKSLPQVISGVNTESLLQAKKFFETLKVETISAESTESAEFIKLISNSYRDLNFAFSNEIAIIGSSYRVNTRDAIKLANYGYPRNQIQNPGLTGGPCLEKDPLILAKSAQMKGVSSFLLSEGRRINESIPTIALQEISQNQLVNQISTPNFLILGIAFKGLPETSDTRGTLAFRLAREINKFFPSSKVLGYDPLISENTEILMSQDLRKSLMSSDVIFIQHNSERLLREFKEISRDSLKSNVVVYDFWDVISQSDLPKNAVLYRFGA